LSGIRRVRAPWYSIRSTGLRQRVELELQGLLPRRSLFCSSATSRNVTTPEYVPTTNCHVSTLLNANRLSAHATTLATAAKKKRRSPANVD